MNSQWLFWNVDTQVDFMDADGKLYVQDAESIKKVLRKLTTFAKDQDITVVNTCDWHHDDSLELSDSPDFITTFPPHCMANTTGASYVEETKPAPPIQWLPWDQENISTELVERNVVIQKDRFDVFEGNPYADDFVKGLARRGIKNIAVYGVATNVCVAAAVEGLYSRGFKVSIVQDAIKELPGIPNPLEGWKDNDEIEVLGSNALIERLA